MYICTFICRNSGSYNSLPHGFAQHIYIHMYTSTYVCECNNISITMRRMRAIFPTVASFSLLNVSLFACKQKQIHCPTWTYFDANILLNRGCDRRLTTNNYNQRLAMKAGWCRNHWLTVVWLIVRWARMTSRQRWRRRRALALVAP